jgi:glycosyltransferase involved in cell wall biosynthesis
MAAGLPVIASDLPAHRDIVRHGETGFLVSTPQELADALNRLSDPSTNQTFGKAARNAAIRLYGTWEDCSSRYLAAYAKLMSA